MSAQRGAFDDLGQLLHALVHDIGRDEVVDERRRFGARPRREHERVRRVVVGLGHDFERAREVGVGLAREADDDVGGDREVRDRGTRGREPFEVARRGVAPVHARERSVAARLQRQVQVLAQRRALGHRRDRLGPEILRVRRGEADAFDAVDRVDGAQQVGEFGPVLARAEVAAVGVHVLAEQRDLGDAVGGERLDLVHDVAHAAADLATAHRRHDAERTGVVAADLDRHPGRVIRVAARGQRRRVRLVLLEDLDDRPFELRAGEQRGRVREVVGAEHDVDVRRRACERVPVLLREATADRDLEVGASVLQRLQVPEMAVQLVVGVLADAARVQHHDVGRLEIRRTLHALGFEHARDAFRVVLVHLAAEGAHEEPAGHECILRAALA